MFLSPVGQLTVKRAFRVSCFETYAAAWKLVTMDLFARLPRVGERLPHQQLVGGVLRLGHGRAAHDHPGRQPLRDPVLDPVPLPRRLPVLHPPPGPPARGGDGADPLVPGLGQGLVLALGIERHDPLAVGQQPPRERGLAFTGGADHRDVLAGLPRVFHVAEERLPRQPDHVDVRRRVSVGDGHQAIIPQWTWTLTCSTHKMTTASTSTTSSSSQMYRGTPLTPAAR